MQHEIYSWAPVLYLFPTVFCLFLDCWEHDEEGSCLTEDFLEALTERMGLHYSNEATGMAATVPSFMPSQPAPFSGEYALYSVIAYSVFFYSPSFLFCAVIPFSLAEEIYNWCVHSCTCTSEQYITWKAWRLEMDPCMYPAFRRSGHLGIRTEWTCAKIVCWLTAWPMCFDMVCFSKGSTAVQWFAPLPHRKKVLGSVQAFLSSCMDCLSTPASPFCPKTKFC